MTFHKSLFPVSFKLLMIFFLALLSACTLKTVQLDNEQKPAQAITYSAEKSWYAARFRINWKEGEEPKWYLGTLIGGEIIKPLLTQYAQQITYWRVHRRAVRDQTGHVFSFIFYSSEASAAKIYQQIQNNKLLLQLQQQQDLLKVSYDPLTTDLNKVLADTSDPVWPAEIRASWPLFMMGASQMWLAQIEIIKQSTPEDKNMVQRYQRIQEQITELWQQQGQHALVHHLSALYAYQPVSMRF